MTGEEINSPARNYLFSRRLGGHRQNYLSVLQGVTGFQPLSGQDTEVKNCQLLNADQLLFATADDDMKTFLSVALQRSLRSKKTVALVLGAGRCFETGRIKYVVKRNTLRLLRKLPTLKTFSILPFYLDSRFSEVTSDWIYDPQFWDLAADLENGQVPQTAIALEMSSLARDRNVLLFLGAPSTIKGFKFLEEILLAQPSLATNMLIVIAGPLNILFKESKTRLSQLGVWFIDKYLDEDEVVSLKAASNTLWACYDPSYNLSSGIFGRALQLDKNVIVRRGSYLENIANHVSYGVDLCEFGNIPEGISVLMRISRRRSAIPAAKLSKLFFDASIPKIQSAVGLVSLPECPPSTKAKSLQ